MLGRFGIVQNGQADLDDAMGWLTSRPNRFLKARANISEIPAGGDRFFSVGSCSFVVSLASNFIAPVWWGVQQRSLVLIGDLDDVRARKSLAMQLPRRTIEHNGYHKNDRPSAVPKPPY